MDPIIPYLACVLGAAALFVLLRPGPRAAKVGASIVGLGLLAWLLFTLADFHVIGRPRTGGGLERTRPEFFFIVFSLIAVGSAVRMITHHRPVYSALYFVMVVLSSAALFLLLQAEFMAFALVIVYAGAILITYMFVLMLAQQTPQGDASAAQADYDVYSREPGYAAVVGFVLLAVFTNMIFVERGTAPQPPSLREANLQTWADLERMPRSVMEVLREHDPQAEPIPDANDRLIRFEGEKPYILYRTPLADSEAAQFFLTAEHAPSNLDRVGLDLVAKFPVSLELAGIILLMAMFGAVVLARKQIELGEDEVREAAGMRRLDLHADEPHPADTDSASAAKGGA